MCVPTDEQLMMSYVEGEQDAFAALFTRYAPLLTRMMSQGLHRPEDANDLVQQAFLQFHRARFDYRAGTRVRPWLVTIAYNLKRSYMRRHKVRKEGALDGEPTDRSQSQCEALEAAQDAGELRLALARLSVSQQQVIELHWFGELSFPEIATLLGTKVSAVKVRAHRGYSALRTSMPRGLGS